ncbi:MAG: L-histidine N(alpha)-methyltransferase [Exilibacterium sp.]
MQQGAKCLQDKNSEDNFLKDVVNGLSQTPKSLPSKYFYDTQGSRYFDEICQLKEYYPYRTELAMLPEIAKDLAHIVKDGRDIVEFGAGSLVKIRLLLQHLPNTRHYLPIDIAGDHLRTASQPLRQEFEGLSVLPIEADFTRQIELPEQTSSKRLGFFPGSTIGNFPPEQAIDFLKSARLTLGSAATLLIGVDTKKSPQILHQAYNDVSGVTMRFNRNILHHVNRHCGSDFNPELFDHYAFYNPIAGRVEMHLISQVAQSVSVDEYTFTFARNESIHTENSHKYSPEEFLSLAAQAGWRKLRQWIGEEQMFAVYLLQNSE